MKQVSVSQDQYNWEEFIPNTPLRKTQSFLSITISNSRHEFFWLKLDYDFLCLPNVTRACPWLRCVLIQDTENKTCQNVAKNHPSTCFRHRTLTMADPNALHKFLIWNPSVIHSDPKTKYYHFCWCIQFPEWKSQETR